MPKEIAHVRVGLSVTLNMQNYESVRAEVAIERPCDPKDTDTCYAETADWARGKVKQEAELMRSAMAEIRNGGA